MNRELFSPPPSTSPTTTNAAGGVAFQRTDAEALAQFACTGFLADTFYTSAESQLTEVLQIAARVDADDVADCAIYARRAHMKDLPVLLVAHLSSRTDEHSKAALRRAFPLVVDNAKQIRNFAQVIRSGRVGRKSFGSLPKKLIVDWFDKQTPTSLYRGNIGDKPSLADVLRMVHAKPQTPTMAALFRQMLGRPMIAGDAENMPAVVVGMQRYLNTRDLHDMPHDAPLQMLTAHAKTRADWIAIAHRASWTETRINLSSFARHGVFDDAAARAHVIATLCDPDTVRRSRVLPFEILNAYTNTAGVVPEDVRGALQDALDVAIENAPVLPGVVAIAVDISGSMGHPLTGVANGGKIRNIDVAALFAAAILRQNQKAVLLPFNTTVHAAALNPRDSVATNTRAISRMLGGGTDCAAPLSALATASRRGAKIDHVVMLSDNESWAQVNAGPRGTAAMGYWREIKRTSPAARLYTIDLSPSATRQASPGDDVLCVGGFSDAVFGAIAAFGRRGSGSWLDLVRSA